MHFLLDCDDTTKEILSCMLELKKVIADTMDCLDHADCRHLRLRISFCILLNEIRKIEDTINNKEFGLQEIKKEIKEIIKLLTTCHATLTTGPVVTDKMAHTLLVKILNNTCDASLKTVTVKIFNLDVCPKQVWETRCVSVAQHCARLECIPLKKGDLCLNEFEIQFSGIVCGIFAWTSTVIAPNNELSAANTFRHSELVPLSC